MASKNFLIAKCLTDLSAQDFGSGLGNFSGSNSNDQHIPVGYTGLISGETYIFDPALLQFTLDFSDVISITSAKLWLKRTTGVHVNLSNPGLRIRRVTAAWSEHGGSENAWSGSTENPATTSTHSVTTVLGTGSNTWQSFDITAIVNDWKAGSANDGLELYVDPAVYSTKTSEFYSMDATSANRPYIELTYVSNRAPNAPTPTSPIGGAVVTTATPTIAFTGSDPDAGDTQLNYDLQVSTDSTFASVTHWNIAAQTTGQTGFAVSRTYGGTALTRGTTYYWRARTTDNSSATGAWTAAQSFRYNALPTVASRTPGSAALGFIHNLGSSLATWLVGGTDAQCRFSFQYNDADGQAMTKYQLRVYNDNAGVAGTLLYDSGQVALGAAAAATVTIDFTGGGFVNGTQYWWSIDVFDGNEWAGESTKTAFKVRWAQGIFEQDTGSASSTNWGMATGTVVKYASLLFRSATSSGGEAATGKTAWKTAMASVTVQQWMQVLVRLSTDAAGTSGSLADMKFTYYGTPNTPDGWSVS